MAVNIPKLKEIYDDIISSLETELNISIPTFGKNFLRAFATVQASKLKLYYLAIANVQKNIFVDTADPESLGGTLERFGRVKLGRNPFQAQQGSYECIVVGDVGAIIKANTTFKSNDSSLNPSKLFVLDSDYTFIAGTNTVILRALESGVGSRLNIGDKLTATSPIANVESIATVFIETITPLEAETIDDYRAKSIEAYQLEPQGGAGSDYRLWGKDAQGVKEIYPYARDGYPNEIQIFVEATIVDSIDGKGTPSQILLDNVESVVEFDPDTSRPLDERGRRPLAVFNIDFNPILINSIDIQIANYIGLTTQIEANITASIAEEIERIRPFIASVDILAAKNDFIDINKIVFQILKVYPGSVFGQIDLRIDSVLYNSFVFDSGNIPFLNSVTYV